MKKLNCEGGKDDMTNLDHLKKVREFDEKSNIYDKLGADEFLEYRQMKALEIIAESLIGIDDKLKSLINDGKVINVDTHEV